MMIDQSLIHFLQQSVVYVPCHFQCYLGQCYLGFDMYLQVVACHLEHWSEDSTVHKKTIVLIQTYKSYHVVSHHRVDAFRDYMSGDLTMRKTHA